MARTVAWFALGALLVGCENTGTIDFGTGAETDARLTSEVGTWNCSGPGEGGEEEFWKGVFQFDITLEVQPDSLSDRDLPGVGECEYGLSMVAEDRLEGGAYLPDVERPGWAAADRTGNLDPVAPGLYRDAVFNNRFQCNDRVEDVLSGGIRLTDGGELFTGAETPEAGLVNDVAIDTELEDGDLTFGDTFKVTWDVTGWDESYVQIRRVRDGLAAETITCNTTGLGEFDIDDAIWGQFNPALGVDRNRLFVGFRNTGSWEATNGQSVEVETRAIHELTLLQSDPE